METILCPKGELFVFYLKGPASLRANNLSRSNLNSKSYVLLISVPTTNMHILIVVNDKKPLTIAKKMYSDFLSVFPQLSSGKCDRGAEWYNAIVESLFSLFNISISISTTNNPKSNPAEKRIGLFSRYIKVWAGKSPIGWGDSVKLIQHISNSMTSQKNQQPICMPLEKGVIRQGHPRFFAKHPPRSRNLG